MTGWLDQPLLDLDRLDLDAADSVSYLLHQVFRYDYDGPAYGVRQRLVALPRDRHGSFHRRARHVSVGAPSRSAIRSDADGNDIVSLELPVVPSSSSSRCRRWSSGSARPPTRCCRPRP